MPRVVPIPAVSFAAASRGPISALIAPPYDVLDEKGKAALLAQDAHNIVAVDLPHLPAKTVGPDATYENAGNTYRRWLRDGVLAKRGKPAVFVYQQTYAHGGQKFQRRGLIANVTIQPFGKPADGKGGGIHPHEQTFGGPKEDRLKLMRATRAQLSPIFGLHSDPKNEVHALLSQVIAAGSGGKPVLAGTTGNDGVLHEAWAVDAEPMLSKLTGAFGGKDIFIADGHHRYTTALNYKNELAAKGSLPADHPANYCLFVLVAMQDPGMIVLPTHRVLGGMKHFTWDGFVKAAAGKLRLEHFPGKDVAALEAALGKASQIPGTGSHAIGVYCPSNTERPLWVATTVEADPLWQSHPKQSGPWRDLDVAIVQYLYVEGLCQPFCEPGQAVAWKFPHTVEEFTRDTNSPGSQIGLLLRPTPLESVRKVSEAGELMPQKSTFFYPKLATGLVINPLE